MIDNNFIWGSAYTNGIYTFFTADNVIAHNMIAGCAKAGIMVRDVPGRPAGNPGGNNQVYNNIIADNEFNVVFYKTNNESDYNLFGAVGTPSEAFQILENGTKVGFSSWNSLGYDTHSTQVSVNLAFDPATLELTWSVSGALPACSLIPAIGYDFGSNPMDPCSVMPGPFGAIPATSTTITVDPRTQTSSDGLPGVEFYGRDSLEVSEQDQTSINISLHLSTEPTEPVNISFSHDQQITVNPSQWTFTQSDYDSPQTLTVTAFDDSLPEGFHATAITSNVNSADPAYQGLTVDDVATYINDNEPICGQSGQQYFEFDVSGPQGFADCYVDVYDFAVLAQKWLMCTDRSNAKCID